MPRPPSKRPTDAELEILQVLWERGPCTVREVHAVVSELRAVGQTTILKLMQIMTEKGLLQRDETRRPQVYAVVRERGDTQRDLVTDLLERAFGGDPGNLVLAALDGRHTTPEERAAILELLRRHEEERE